MAWATLKTANFKCQSPNVNRDSHAVRTRNSLTDGGGDGAFHHFTCGRCTCSGNGVCTARDAGTLLVDLGGLFNPSGCRCTCFFPRHSLRAFLRPQRILSLPLFRLPRGVPGRFRSLARGGDILRKVVLLFSILLPFNGKPWCSRCLHQRRPGHRFVVSLR